MPIERHSVCEKHSLVPLFVVACCAWDGFVVDIDHSRFINPNRNNNYWQMDDILFEPMKIKQQYIRKIKDMFANGVRMWDVEALTGGGLG